MPYLIFRIPRDKKWNYIGSMAIKNGDGIGFYDVFQYKRSNQYKAVVMTRRVVDGEEVFVYKWRMLRKLRSNWGKKPRAEFEAL